MMKLTAIYAFFILLFFFIAIVAVLPAYAQLNKVDQSKESFIEKGTVLTGLYFSFINGSEQEFTQNYTREDTRVSLNLEGTYFITDRIGFGPLISYVFSYGDLNVLNPDKGDIETRDSFWIVGTKITYLLPLNELFERYNATNLFFNAGPVLHILTTERESVQGMNPRIEFGYGIGTGLLFAISKQIAVTTKLNFQAHRHKYEVGTKSSVQTEVKWLEAIAFSVGLSFTF